MKPHFTLMLKRRQPLDYILIISGYYYARNLATEIISLTIPIIYTKMHTVNHIFLSPSYEWANVFDSRADIMISFSYHLLYDDKRIGNP